VLRFRVVFDEFTHSEMDDQDAIFGKKLGYFSRLVVLPVKFKGDCAPFLGTAELANCCRRLS
jgi:hypothetical protein